MDDNEPIITNKNVKVISWIMLVILGVFSIWLVVSIINNTRTRAVYDDAEKLIAEEQYARASEQLGRIKDSKYKDTERAAPPNMTSCDCMDLSFKHHHEE